MLRVSNLPPLALDANKILVLRIKGFLSKSTPHYMDFAETDWSAEQLQGERFA